MTRNDNEFQDGTASGSGTTTTDKFVFPRWTNRLREISAVAALGGLVYAVVLVYGVFSPETSAMGYAPTQPVSYSHALHVGAMGIDCRYCHTSVETTAKANIPPTSTCMNCHSHVRTESPKLELVRKSAETGEPIPWVRVHDLPDFVYFNHAGHIQSGVGCVSCHGRIDRMEVVAQDKPLTMGWCLGCHRNPEPNLRPKEFVTDMTWQPPNGEDPADLGARLMKEHGIAPSTDCATCHR
ncbi:cytochrome C [bacterium CG17_big_fil_post_rev_8_21_14_2_50_64_8]|nr:MAG: cytochrome C [bacterium CG17_big_fil_post_rev_8_21_14_2_50_64_8]PJA73193.1 MAG: cytochrome C [bacterium CG_4_9_14_3_um_filter_65_15]